MRAAAIYGGLLLCMLGGPGCPAPPPEPDPEPPRAQPSQVLALEARTLKFAPSRADMTIGKAVLSVYCSEPEETLINGEPPARQWSYRELEPLGKNTYGLPSLRVERTGLSAGLVCVSLKVWFNEVGNKYDSLFYTHLEDRYALVSFSTRTEGPDWEQARPRFSQNRVDTMAQFRARIARPLVIRLNRRPLSDVAAFEAK